MRTKSSYYWDANVFISLIKGKDKRENRTEEELTNLKAVFQEIDENKAILVTSTITSIEVRAGDLTPEQREKYDSIFKRPNLVPINVHRNIAEKASEIREYYLSSGKKLAVVDCIHLATAILADVDILHTFDDDDLLKLDGNVMGHNVKIRKPSLPQGILGI